MTSAGALAAIGIIVFVSSFLGVAVVRSIAIRLNWLDYPNNRSSHRVATPRGGGLAIAIVSVTASIAILSRGQLLTPDWKMVVAGAVIVAVVSWIDDLWTVSSTVRLSIHIAAAITVLVAVDNATENPYFGTLLRQAAAATIALLWIVGLTNAYNFMDGIDLIAAGQGIAAGVGWALVGALFESADLALVGTVVASAVAGFAILNRPPALIFMGDVGSTFLGYLLAAITILGASRDPLLGICGVLLVWPFVFDASFTFFRRLRIREPVFQAHRSHLYQRLVITKMTHFQVSFLYFNLALVGVLCAVALIAEMPQAPAISAIAITASAWGLWLFVVYKEKTARTARANTG
jgi:Fuc2NAc and GlcNAc transferase